MTAIVFSPQLKSTARFEMFWIGNGVSKSRASWTFLLLRYSESGFTRLFCSNCTDRSAMTKHVSDQPSTRELRGCDYSYTSIVILYLSETLKHKDSGDPQFSRVLVRDLYRFERVNECGVRVTWRYRTRKEVGTYVFVLQLLLGQSLGQPVLRRHAR